MNDNEDKLRLVKELNLSMSHCKNIKEVKLVIEEVYHSIFNPAYAIISNYLYNSSHF